MISLLPWRFGDSHREATYVLICSFCHILLHPWFCRNPISWRRWTMCGLAQVDMGFLSSKQKSKPVKYLTYHCVHYHLVEIQAGFLSHLIEFSDVFSVIWLYRFMVASVLGIAGSGCFSGSDDPAEEGLFFLLDAPQCPTGAAIWFLVCLILWLFLFMG